MSGANAELLRSRRALTQFRLLSEITRETILFINHDTMKIFNVNAAAAASYGYRHEELVGMPLATVWPDHRERLDDAALREGVGVESEHVRHSGERFPVEVLARSSEQLGRVIARWLPDNAPLVEAGISGYATTSSVENRS